MIRGRPLEGSFTAASDSGLPFPLGSVLSWAQHRNDGLRGDVIADCECPAAGGWTPYLTANTFFFSFFLTEFHFNLF